MADTKRVRVVLEIDVDVDAWALDYGVTESEVPTDVTDYVRNVVNEGPAGFEFMTLVN